MGRGALTLEDTQTRPCPCLCAQAHTRDSWFLAGTVGFRAAEVGLYQEGFQARLWCKLTSE